MRSRYRDRVPEPNEARLLRAQRSTPQSPGPLQAVTSEHVSDVRTRRPRPETRVNARRCDGCRKTKPLSAFRLRDGRSVPWCASCRQSWLHRRGMKQKRMSAT
jgi:hypothetical protein